MLHAVRLIILTFLAKTTFAQTDLMQQAHKTEQWLLAQHPMLQVPAFEAHCLDLIQRLALPGLNRCHALQAEYDNAWVLANGHVYFTLGLLQQIRNDHQLAAVLAHEAAHHFLDHHRQLLERLRKPGFFFPKKRFEKMRRAQEKDADAWAETQLLEQGMRPGQLIFLHARLASVPRKGHTHPRGLHRGGPPDADELSDAGWRAVLDALEATQNDL